MHLGRSVLFLVAVIASAAFLRLAFLSSTASAQGLEATVPSLEASWEKRAALHSSLVAFLKSKPRVGDDFEVLWRMSRLAYYAGFFVLPSEGRKEEKADVFKFGSEMGERARRLNPARVEGHYWYAISVGGLGISKGIMASLGSASDMRTALDEAVKIDAKYHFAGPLRVRGRLFYKLPGGFLSFGDNKKALADLRKALELGPESKLNYAYLAEVVDAVEGAPSALKILEAAKKLPDVAGEVEEASYRRDIANLERRLK